MPHAISVPSQLQSWNMKTGSKVLHGNKLRDQEVPSSAVLGRTLHPRHSPIAMTPTNKVRGQFFVEHTAQNRI